MSKFVCQCGDVISAVKYPPNEEFILMSEASLGEFLSLVEEVLSKIRKSDDSDERNQWLAEALGTDYPTDATDGEILSDILSQKVTELSVAVTKCHSCGRVHIQNNPGENSYSSYIPD